MERGVCVSPVTLPLIVSSHADERRERSRLPASSTEFLEVVMSKGLER